MPDPRPTRTVEPPLLNLTVAQLSYLAAVADHETFAEAAAAVGVTTSALSQGLAELERRLGTSLFERSGRRQILRTDAEPIVRYAQSVVATTRDLGRWIESFHSGDRGRVTVGMIDAAAVVWFPECIRAFRSEFPEVVFQLVVAPSGELLEQLERGDIDLAIVIDRAELIGQFQIDVLGTETIYVVPPSGVSVKEIGDGPWALFPKGSHSRQLIEEALRQKNIRPDVTTESHQPEVLRELAHVGLGWTALPESAFAPSDAALVQLKKSGAALTERRVVMVRRENRSETAATLQFIERVKATTFS